MCIRDRHTHLQRLPDHEWLSTHQQALTTAANELAAYCRTSSSPTVSDASRRGLTSAAALARLLNQTDDAAKWAGAATRLGNTEDASLSDQPSPNATSIWNLLGITTANGELTIHRQWPSHWDWWALIQLPYRAQAEEDTVSLLWDGDTLHTTRPVAFDGPVTLQNQVQPFGSDEHSFNLRFRLGTDLFVPTFLQST